MTATGILYLEMFYPGFISLHVGTWYIFPFNKTKAAIAIDRHIEATRVINFSVGPDAWPVSSDFAATSSAALTVEYGVGPLPYKKKVIIDHQLGKLINSTSYTVLILALESYPKGNGYHNESSFDEILASFVGKYRVIAGDINIRTLAQSPAERYYTRRYFHHYTPEERNLPLERRLTAKRNQHLSLGIFKFHDFVEAVPFRTPEETSLISRDMQKLLSDNQALGDLTPREQIYTIAREINVNRNFKFALLQAFIYCETLIAGFLRKKKLAAGVSNKKLGDLESEIPISYMIAVELPCFISCDKNKRQQLGELDRIRRLRNDVVHRGGEVSEKDARSALDALEKLHDMLSNNG